MLFSGYTDNLREFNLNLSKIFLVVALVAGVLISWASISGFKTVEASGTCFEEEVRCHGIPFSNQCFGIEDRNYEYVPKETCEEVDEIRTRCDRLKDISCRRDNRWINDSVAFGRSCAEWNQTYDMGMKACEQ